MYNEVYNHHQLLTVSSDQENAQFKPSARRLSFAQNSTLL